MSVVWNLVTVSILIGIQLVAILLICRRHKREMDVQTGMMVILIATMQPREIRAHCRRVAEISEMMARAMKLPAKRLALVRAVGIIHEIDDIGSITTNMPLEFAILSVADHFDCVTHDGSESLSKDDAIEEIRREAGSRFDPAVVKALMTVAACLGDIEQEPAHIGK